MISRFIFAEIDLPVDVDKILKVSGEEFFLTYHGEIFAEVANQYPATRKWYDFHRHPTNKMKNIIEQC